MSEKPADSLLLEHGKHEALFLESYPSPYVTAVLITMIVMILNISRWNHCNHFEPSALIIMKRYVHVLYQNSSHQKICIINRLKSDCQQKTELSYFAHHFPTTIAATLPRKEKKKLGFPDSPGGAGSCWFGGAGKDCWRWQLGRNIGTSRIKVGFAFTLPTVPPRLLLLLVKLSFAEHLARYNKQTLSKKFLQERNTAFNVHYQHNSIYIYIYIKRTTASNSFSLSSFRRICSSTSCSRAMTYCKNLSAITTPFTNETSWKLRAWEHLPPAAGQLPVRPVAQVLALSQYWYK